MRSYLLFGTPHLGLHFIKNLSNVKVLEEYNTLFIQPCLAYTVLQIEPGTCFML